jgi:predicted phage terminase large subunit-like protein
MAQSKPEAPLVASEDSATIAICKRSFYHFLVEFWDEVVNEDPVWNWHIKYICDELQVMAERVFKNLPKEHDLIINVPPGSTKSTICSIAFPAWFWTRMSTGRVISASYEHELALNFARKSRDIIESEKYQRYFPGLKLKLDQNAKRHYVNEQGGERKSVGAGGNITGSHGHIILVDDPLNPKEAVSEQGLKKINRWMSETLPTRKVNKEVVPTIVIMQRLHQDDPTGHMLLKAEGHPAKKVKHICLPAEKSELVKPGRLKLRYVDGLLDPLRISKKVLAEARIDLGAFGYAGQFDQHPVPLGGGLFKWERLRFDVAPPLRDFVMLVRYWDKAGTHADGAYSAGVLMGKDKYGRFWILDVVRGQWDSAERERVIRKTAEMDGKKVWVAIEQEPGSGGKESAENTVRKTLVGYRVIIDKVSGSKEFRAEPFSTQVNAGNVFIKKDGVWVKEFVDEMKFFPYSRYKDQIDAASGAFARLNARRRVGGLESKDRVVEEVA